jgi:ABC transport system ATP-binding/permease protein
MPPPLLRLQDISLTFGAAPLLSGAGLAVAIGDRICLVGRNGSGKSTLLRIAAGLVQPDAGERFVQPGTTIQYLSQEPDLAGFGTALAYVEAGFDAAAADGRHRALYLLKELGLSGNEHPASLSGGEARRAALARALAPSPDILLLDEPTNHLDLPGIEWLEQELAGMRSGIVLVSHDRRLLERFSRSTVWLDRGITRALDEGFSAFEAWRDAILEQEESEQHKLGRKIAMEEDWLRYGVLNLLTGTLAPDAGGIRLGTNLAQVTLDQRRESLDPEQSLSGALTGGSGDVVTVDAQSRHVIGYMKDFLFRPGASPHPGRCAVRRRAGSAHPGTRLRAAV